MSELKNTLYRRIMTGDWVHLVLNKKRMYFVLYFVGLVIIYISFLAKVEKKQMEINKLEDILEVKRSEAALYSSRIFNKTMQHSLTEKCEKMNLGISVSNKPHRIIVIEKEAEHK